MNLGCVGGRETVTSSLQSDLAWSQMWGVGVASFPVFGHRCLCLGVPPPPALYLTVEGEEREAHSQRVGDRE